jgi:hypothetical protein
MTGRDAVLQAFDRLFDRAAAQLHVDCTVEEKEQAKQQFAERVSSALEVAAQVAVPGIPPEVMQTMESAIDHMSPAQLVGYLASIPLVQQVQEMLQQIAYRAAEQRLLDHLVRQADDRYGGN